LLTVHTNILFPGARAFICEVPDVLFEIEAEPLTSDQIPVPAVGVIALMLEEVEQIVWFAPADEKGKSSRVIITLAVAGEHTPLLTVHWNKLFPTLSCVTCELFNVGLVTDALPVSTDQTPVPTVGAIALSVPVVEHKV
jgi:hypothetical protein